jgi:rod shape-determining protein MreC
MEPSGIRPRDWIVLLALVVLGAVLGADRGVVSKPLTDTVRSVFCGPQGIVNSALVSTGDLFIGIGQAPHLRNRVRELERDRAAAVSQQVKIDELDQENRRLHALLETLRQTPGKPLPASVIAYYPQTLTAMLSVGSEDGVRVGNPVVAPHGLAGIVQLVDRNSCVVLMVTADRFAVGSRVAREGSRAAGVAKGLGGDMLLLDHLSEGADVAVGDKIVTSGVGERYPKGLFVGTVKQVWRDRSYGYMRAWVEPSVQPDALEEAIVLR